MARKKKQAEEKEIYDIYTGEYRELNSEEKRALFDERFNKALAEYTEEIKKIDEREKLYFGTQEVKKSVTNKDSKNARIKLKNGPAKITEKRNK